MSVDHEKKDTIRLTELADVLDEPKENPKRQATKEEIDELTAHFGGVERWGAVCDDFKILMAGYLDYKSQIVQDASIWVRYLGITGDERSQSVTVDVKFGKHSNDDSNLRIQFKERHGHTAVTWYNRKDGWTKDEDAVIRENCNYCEEGVRFAIACMKKCRFRMDHICIGMKNFPTDGDDIEFFPNCKHFEIKPRSDHNLQWWLRKLPEHLDCLSVFSLPDSEPLSSHVLGLPQVMNCKTIAFDSPVHLTNEQFVRMAAQWSRFESRSLNEEGINGFLKKWARGEGVEGFAEAFLSLSNRSLHRRSYDASRVLNGLQTQNVKHHGTREFGCEVVSENDPSKVLKVWIASYGCKIKDPRS